MCHSLPPSLHHSPRKKSRPTLSCPIVRNFKFHLLQQIYGFCAMLPCGIATRFCRPQGCDHWTPLNLESSWNYPASLFRQSLASLYSQAFVTVHFVSECTIPRRKHLNSFWHQKNSSPQWIDSGYYVPWPRTVSHTLGPTRSLTMTLRLQSVKNLPRSDIHITRLSASRKSFIVNVYPFLLLRTTDLALQC